ERERERNKKGRNSAEREGWGLSQQSPSQRTRRGVEYKNRAFCTHTTTHTHTHTHTHNHTHFPLFSSLVHTVTLVRVGTLGWASDVTLKSGVCVCVCVRVCVCVCVCEVS